MFILIRAMAQCQFPATLLLLWLSSINVWNKIKGILILRKRDHYLGFQGKHKYKMQQVMLICTKHCWWNLPPSLSNAVPEQLQTSKSWQMCVPFLYSRCNQWVEVHHSPTAGMASEERSCNFHSEEAAALCRALKFSSIPDGCSGV